jgi:hypothetical protein
VTYMRQKKIWNWLCNILSVLQTSFEVKKLLVQLTNANLKLHSLQPSLNSKFNMERGTVNVNISVTLHLAVG